MTTEPVNQNILFKIEMESKRQPKKVHLNVVQMPQDKRDLGHNLLGDQSRDIRLAITQGQQIGSKTQLWCASDTCLNSC